MNLSLYLLRAICLAEGVLYAAKCIAAQWQLDSVMTVFATLLLSLLRSGAGSFSSSGGSSFTSRPSHQPPFSLQPVPPPLGTSGSGSSAGHDSWGALISGAAPEPTSMGTGSRPFSYPGSLPPPPLGSGPPAQHHQAEQQQQQQRQQPHKSFSQPQLHVASAAAGGGAIAASGGGDGRSSAADDATHELQLAFRNAAVAALSKRLASSVAAASSGASTEVELLLSAQAELARREVQLQQEVGANLLQPPPLLQLVLCWLHLLLAASSSLALHMVMV